MRVMPSLCSTMPPKRSPIFWVTKPKVATAAMPRSRFVTAPVPQFIDGVASSRAHTSSSRSAMVSRTCGTVVRAVTAQSMRRTSSWPGT